MGLPQGHLVRLTVPRQLCRCAPPRPGNLVFVTSDDPTWRVAPSRDGVEDAIHNKDMSYSITYTSVVEEWDRRDGASSEFTSTVVMASPLSTNGGSDDDDDPKHCQ
ncbi:hypothetical protein ABZP36_003883 [Zizania latifolia]